MHKFPLAMASLYYLHNVGASKLVLGLVATVIILEIIGEIILAVWPK